MAELEQIEGTVEDIIYENEDNGYTVFELSGGGVVTVVCGIVGELHAGESVVCRGRYENHATYGRQFHAQECETDMPKDLEAVYAFLASGSLPYMDGTDIRVPFFTNYDAKTGQWIVENHGVDPDILIDNDPIREAAGEDQQLLKAIEVALQQLKERKPLPGVPAPRTFKDLGL